MPAISLPTGSLHDILEDVRSVTLQQHEMDEAAREQRRGELHAARGVRRAGGARTRGSVVRSSLMISVVLGNKQQGLQGSTTLETDGSATGGGDLRDAKDSLRALRTKTKALAGLALAGDGNEKRRYTTKADWERFGVVEGGAVMVKAPRSDPRKGMNFTGAKGRVGAEAVAGGEEAAWQQGTVTAVTRKRVSVAYGGGGKITFEASDPAACTSLCGFAVEHAPLAGKGGIDPIYFGFMFIYVGCIGLITPPVGTVQNVIAGVGRLRMETVIKGTNPFLMVYVLLAVLFVIFPQIILAPLRWMH